MKRKTLLHYFWSCVTADYLNFNRRARRMEFWGFTVISYALSVLTGMLDNQLLSYCNQDIFIEHTWYDQFLTISGIFSLLVFVPSIAVGVRRFHDVGKFGWLYIAFGVFQISNWLPYDFTERIPFQFAWILHAAGLLAVIWIVVILFTSGDEGPNEYGLDPKNPVLGDELDQIGTE